MRNGQHPADPVRRLRVVFSIDNMGVGGTELNAVRTAERLTAAGHEVSVVCLGAGGPLLARYAAAGVAVHAVPLRRLYGARAARQFTRLYAWLRRTRPDIVHAHDLYSNQFTVPAARLAGVPGVIASRRWGQPLPGLMRDRVHRAMSSTAHRVVTNSERLARLLEEREHVPSGRIAVIRNFLDPSAFDVPSAEERASYRRRHAIASQDVVLGVVANLRPVKDHETLLRAAALLGAEPYQLVLVGDGPSRADLEATAARLGIAGRVVFAGAGEPGRNHHAHFDVSLLTSRSEGFPNSLLEAMAAGKPVIATAVGGVPEVIIEGETGLLVESGDASSLAAAIRRLIGDASLREALGARGRERARDGFTAERVLPVLESLYIELAGAARAVRSGARAPNAPNTGSLHGGEVRG